jgi:hypothetical protein
MSETAQLHALPGDFRIAVKPVRVFQKYSSVNHESYILRKFQASKIPIYCMDI